MTGAAVANAGVAIRIRAAASGVVRTVNATTDAQGNFATVFKPLAGEAGDYEVWATHPAGSHAAAQDRFSILGMKGDASALTLSLVGADSGTVQLLLSNSSGVALTGLNATLQGMPNFVDSSATVSSSTLLPGGSVQVTVSANSTSDLSGSGQAKLRVTTDEGVTLDVPLTLQLTRLTVELATNPGALDAGMLRGRATLVSFEVVNRGGADTGQLQLLLPDAPWLSAASATQIENLAPGERTVVTLRLSPSQTLQLGRYAGEVVLAGANTSLSVPFQFMLVGRETFPVSTRGTFDAP